MSLRRVRILLAAGVSSLLLAGLAVAESSSASPPDTATESSEVALSTVAESSLATASDTVVEASVSTTPESPAVEILPPDESWAGATRGEWDARGWQWVVSLPADINPAVDGSGDFCGYGQFGPVFFLPGSFATGAATTCVVAEGTAIFASAGAECSTVEPPPYFGRNEEELRACVTAALDDFSPFRVRINGQEVADLDDYRTTSPPFTLTFPENNVFDVEPGVALAVAESYSFIIAPPPPGEYEIVYWLPGEPEEVFSTVTLRVEAPQVIEPPAT
jgi:hypothetical protein